MGAESSQRATGGRILLVDDDQNILRSFRMCLEADGHRVATATASAGALELLQRQVFDLCFLDLRLGRESGLELLPRIRALAPWVRVVMATANSAIDNAVAAMRSGAVDYIVKPCSPEQLRATAKVQLDARRVALRLEALERESRAREPGDLDTRSPAMARVLDEARRVADTDASVLLLGESGTGKGVLARAVHRLSPRGDQSFVTINCPALSAELLESELFGHRKGAFTGAVENTEGRVAQADAGTLFLDEVGDFPLALQPKLLRFVQDREYERVGDPVTRVANVRIVAATNRDLAAMVREGLYREDLLYRLNVITLTVPPLRERREDLLPIAGNLLRQFASDYGRPARSLTSDAEAALLSHAWPGNIRELRNTIERAVILCPEEAVSASQLSLGAQAPVAMAGNGTQVGAPVTLQALERAHIERIIATSETLDAAARTLGIDASTLYRKRRQYGLL